MILGINSVCHTWHVVQHSCVLIFMKKKKEGKQKGRRGERKEGRQEGKKEKRKEGEGRRKEGKKKALV